MSLGKLITLVFIALAVMVSQPSLAQTTQTSKKKTQKVSQTKAKKAAPKRASKAVAPKAAAQKRVVAPRAVAPKAAAPTPAAAAPKPASKPAPKKEAPVVEAPPPTEEAHAPKVKGSTGYKFGVGGGYLIFNEVLSGTDATTSEKGRANYAGLTVFVDQSLLTENWVFGGTLGFGLGKATASFPTISYPDSGHRAWTLLYVEGYTLYRVSANVMTGVGAMGGFRWAEWKSTANPSLTVPLNKTYYAPELIFRWALSERITFSQVLAAPDLRGTPLWKWSAHYNF